MCRMVIQAINHFSGIKRYTGHNGNVSLSSQWSYLTFLYLLALGSSVGGGSPFSPVSYLDGATCLFLEKSIA